MVTLEQKDRNSGHKAASHGSVGILIHPTSLESVMCPGQYADIGLLALSVAWLGPVPGLVGDEGGAFAGPRASRLGHSQSQITAAPRWMGH